MSAVQPAGRAGTFCTPSEGMTKLCCSVATCGAGEYCAPASLPAKVGTCVKGARAACTTATECGTGFCVDGVCCDTACNGQCEACDGAGASKGKCTAVKGDVHGSRTACSTGGGDICRALACDGTDRLKCAAFKNGLDAECSPASCAGGIETPASFCDGAGSCKAGTTRPCAPFACGDKACKKTCTAATDCLKGNVCDPASGQCVPAKSSCSADFSSSVPADGSGTPKPCSPFLCNPATGDCYESCTSSTQCASGFACDGAKCVPSAVPTADDSGGCGCEVVGTTGRGSSAAWAVAVGLMLVGLARRRRD